MLSAFRSGSLAYASVYDWIYNPVNRHWFIAFLEAHTGGYRHSVHDDLV